MVGIPVITRVKGALISHIIPSGVIPSGDADIWSISWCFILPNSIKVVLCFNSYNCWIIGSYFIPHKQWGPGLKPCGS